MSPERLVSIVISSFNYDRYLRASIDSALGQDYPNTEVIVVDDGSTDGSRDIVSSYGFSITAVLKDNGGQASAFNAGVARSSGDVVVFLDSDDVLLPTALKQAVGHFENPAVAKVHWPLQLIDESGRPGNKTVPASPIDEGDLLEAVVHGGPDGYSWPPTSGNAWSRHFIDAVFPIPEEDYRVCPDLYLAALAPLYGLVCKVSEPQAFWRIHGENASWCQPLDERVRYQARLWERCFETLESRGSERGVHIDPRELRVNSWWHRISETVDEITALVPPGGKLILVDEDQWGPGTDIAGRSRIPFPQKNGQFWGLPANDDDAIRETERLRQSGADVMAIVWPAFWWLEYYDGLNQYLRRTYPCLIENDRVIAFDLGRLVRKESQSSGGRP